MPKKFYISELFPHQLYNGAIGREDIEAMLASLNYYKIELGDERKGFLLKLKSYLRAKRFARNLNEEDIVFFPFPLFSRVKQTFLKKLNKRKVKTVAYIHDIEGVRDENTQLLDIELSFLSLLSGAIVLNKTMQAFVNEQCPNLSTSTLLIWDYLLPHLPLNSRIKSNQVMFAGNHDKAQFIQLLNQATGIQFHLYGIETFDAYPENCKTYGAVDSKQLPMISKGSFGLVWDGPSIETCEGGAGKYLRFNSPHKLSLYLLAGLPVLIWEGAALAEWVVEHGFGVAIKNLYALNETIEAITDEEYAIMQKKISEIQPLIASGKFFINAFEKITGNWR